MIFFLIANDCGIPESIDNGDVSYPSTTLSSIAVYDCDAGYTLIGTNDSVVCNENGQWTGPTPTCTGKINQTDYSEILNLYFIILWHAILLL